MFFVVTVYMLAIFNQIQTSKGHDQQLQNVAYSKAVTLSSQYPDRGYEGWKAVNGIFSDLSHTGRERFPWLRIDLGANFLIHEIEVFARSDCCGSQLHDLDVKVGNVTDSMHLCGHFTGYTWTGGRIAVWCPTPTVGRYVQIQIVKGDSNVMSPAEVLVWGKRV
uniref:Fucolectin-like n=1 Tax=Crassostrea virginica TaxID=6565 RepID=A0A8B8AXN3_CRAVI|nr:fucolectin-like [Crassostrea virginica]